MKACALFLGVELCIHSGCVDYQQANTEAGIAGSSKLKVQDSMHTSKTKGLPSDLSCSPHGICHCLCGFECLQCKFQP